KRKGEGGIAGTGDPDFHGFLRKKVETSVEDSESKFALARLVGLAHPLDGGDHLPALRIDEARRDEDEQFAFGVVGGALLEELAEDGDVAEQRDLGDALLLVEGVDAGKHDGLA